MVTHIKKAAVLFLFSQVFLGAVSIHAQEREGGNAEQKAVRYGLQLGISENKVDIYSTLGGGAHALEQGNSSFYAPRFFFGVSTDIRLGRCFSLRVMPGVSVIDYQWEPGTAVVPAGDYKVESVRGELPVDVKFHPLRMGRLCPYLCSGLDYNLDFTSLRKDDDKGLVPRLNAHDLRYICGVGVDCDTRYLNVGVELNASLGLLSPGKGDAGGGNSFFFHDGPIFSLVFNIKA